GVRHDPAAAVDRRHAHRRALRLAGAAAPAGARPDAPDRPRPGRADRPRPPGQRARAPGDAGGWRAAHARSAHLRDPRRHQRRGRAGDEPVGPARDERPHRRGLLARQNLPIDDFLLHFESTGAGGDSLRGVRIERWEGDVLTLLRADTARFDGSDLVLTGYRIDRLDLGALDQPVSDPALALANLVRLRNVATDPQQTLVVTTSYTADDLIARFSGGGFEDSRSLTELRRDAENALVSADERRQAQVLLQRKLAEPFTNLALLLVAVPLALSYSRSRGVAFGVSLV